MSDTPDESAINQDDTSQNPSENKDVVDFNRTLSNAIIVMLLVIVYALFGVWRDWENPKIIFVEPLRISLEDSSSCPEALRCYSIESSIADNQPEPHPVSVMDMVKRVMTVLALYITFFTYGDIPLRQLFADLFSSDRLESIVVVLRNLLIGLALAMFLWVVFSAMDVLAGLAAINSAPVHMNLSVAVLTVAVFVAVSTFLLIQWVIDLDLVNIGRAGIVILMVSYSLSIPFSTQDWNFAYSALGESNTSAIVGGGHGSQALFLFAMVGMGMIFMAFAIDIVRLFVTHFSETTNTALSGNVWARSSVAILGILAGLGSVFVGIAPSNTNPSLHDIGAYGAPIASLILVLLLVLMYPKETINNYKNHKTMIIILGATLILTLILVGVLKAVLGEGISILELEFAYFFLFLLFIQIYSTYFTEYIDEKTGQQNYQSFRGTRRYPFGAI